MRRVVFLALALVLVVFVATRLLIPPQPREVYRFPAGADLLRYDYWARGPWLLVLDRETGKVELLADERGKPPVRREVTLPREDGRLPWSVCFDAASERLFVLECTAPPRLPPDGVPNSEGFRLYLRVLDLARGGVRPAVEIDPAALIEAHYEARGEPLGELSGRLRGARYHLEPWMFEALDGETVALNVRDHSARAFPTLALGADGALLQLAPGYPFASRATPEGWEIVYTGETDTLFRLTQAGEERAEGAGTRHALLFSHPVGFLGAGEIVAVGDGEAVVLDARLRRRRTVKLPGEWFSAAYVRNDALLWAVRDARGLALVELPLRRW